MKLEVFPRVFHPRYFGSGSILAKFVGPMPLREKSFLEVGCGTGIVALCGQGGSGGDGRGYLRSRRRWRISDENVNLFCFLDAFGLEGQ